VSPPLIPPISDIIREQAEAGDAEAQYQLGEMFYRGRDVPKDMSAAIKWFRKAAAQGNASAQTFLAALQGDADAQYRLGEENRNHHGNFGFEVYFSPGALAEALKWYRMAAEQGHADAQFQLAVMYIIGGRVPFNTSDDYHRYKMALEKSVKADGARFSVQNSAAK
jgi:TPR repeat protein